MSVSKKSECWCHRSFPRPGWNLLKRENCPSVSSGRRLVYIYDKNRFSSAAIVKYPTSLLLSLALKSLPLQYHSVKWDFLPFSMLVRPCRSSLMLLLPLLPAQRQTKWSPLLYSCRLNRGEPGSVQRRFFIVTQSLRKKGVWPDSGRWSQEECCKSTITVFTAQARHVQWCHSLASLSTIKPAQVNLITSATFLQSLTSGGKKAKINKLATA